MAVSNTGSWSELRPPSGGWRFPKPAFKEQSLFNYIISGRNIGYIIKHSKNSHFWYIFDWVLFDIIVPLKNSHTSTTSFQVGTFSNIVYIIKHSKTVDNRKTSDVDLIEFCWYNSSFTSFSCASSQIGTFANIVQKIKFFN